MKKILVSLIIPVYNAESSIKKCLDSIICQTYTSFEVLIIDDGSSDCSKLICEEYAKRDRRIRVYSKSNGGVSSARNFGLKEGRGDYFAFIDADDYIKPDYLNGLIVADTDFILSGYESPYRSFTPVEKKITRENINESIDYLLSSDLLFTPWAKLFRKDVIIKYSLLFDEKMRLEEDTNFVYEFLSRCDSISLINRKDYYYTGIWGGGNKYCLSWSEVVYIYKKNYASLALLEQAFNQNHLISRYMRIPRFSHISNIYEETTAVQCYNLYCSYKEKIEPFVFFSSIVSFDTLAEKLIQSINNREFCRYSNVVRKFVDVPHNYYNVNGRVKKICLYMTVNRIYVLYPVVFGYILVKRFCTKFLAVAKFAAVDYISRKITRL